MVEHRTCYLEVVGSDPTLSANSLSFIYHFIFLSYHSEIPLFTQKERIIPLRYHWRSCFTVGFPYYVRSESPSECVRACVTIIWDESTAVLCESLNYRFYFASIEVHHLPLNRTFPSG